MSKEKPEETLFEHITRLAGENTCKGTIFTCSDKSLGNVLQQIVIYFLQSLEKIKPHPREKVRKNAAK